MKNYNKGNFIGCFIKYFPHKHYWQKILQTQSYNKEFYYTLFSILGSCFMAQQVIFLDLLISSLTWRTESYNHLSRKSPRTIQSNHNVQVLFRFFSLLSSEDRMCCLKVTVLDVKINQTFNKMAIRQITCKSKARRSANSGRDKITCFSACFTKMGFYCYWLQNLFRQMMVRQNIM